MVKPCVENPILGYSTLDTFSTFCNLTPACYAWWAMICLIILEQIQLWIRVFSIGFHRSIKCPDEKIMSEKNKCPGVCTLTSYSTTACFGKKSICNSKKTPKLRLWSSPYSACDIDMWHTCRPAGFLDLNPWRNQKPFLTTIFIQHTSS